jgi:hypothetical protein
LAGGWSIFWNELLDGAPPGAARLAARSASVIGRAVTRYSAAGRWLDDAWAPATR